MADILFDAQGAPPTPASGQVLLWPDSSSKAWTSKNSDGAIRTLAGIRNFNTADVVANAADTYLSGSALAVPAHLLQAGTIMKWRLAVTKTAAGVAAPIWNVRIGTLGTVADAARLVFMGPIQTAAVDAGIVEITALLRNTGAAGVLAGILTLGHNLALTGLATLGQPTLQVTSAGFDTTAAGLIIGLSCNPGAAGVWTHQLVTAEMFNI